MFTNLRESFHKNKLNFLSALAITIIFYTLEEVIFNYPQVNYFLGIYNSSEAYTLKLYAITSTLLMFIATSIFFYGFFVSPIWLKFVYAFLFISITIGEYGYQKAVQRFVLAWDIEIGITSPTGMWVDALKLFFDWKTLIPFTILAIFLWRTRVNQDSNSKSGVFALILVFAIISIQPYIKPAPTYGLNWGISTMQGLNAGVSYLHLRASFVEREKIIYRAPNPPTNNIVLIIDESLRGDHLSVNGYYRSTTPHLEALSQQGEFFHNWGIATSGATCSNSSNGLLITGAPIEKGGLNYIRSYPTIFQYAKAMGYQTIYMDAQTNQFWNGLNSKDSTYLDRRITEKDLNLRKYNADFQAVEILNQILRGSTGNFIVLNKHGVHFIYEDAYPRWATVWSPVPETIEEFESNPQLTSNSYDNAILYNVNGFFERLFPDPEDLVIYTENTFFIYTSDHSETLYEDGATSSHCSGTKVETQVPLIIFGKLPLNIDTNYKASHSNIFPTILDLMNVPKDAQIQQYSPSLLKAKERDTQDRLFFNSDGTILNYETLP